MSNEIGTSKSIEGLFYKLGFCGIDDSIDPNILVMMSHHYPFIEWGVLLREDKQGTPRYASEAYIQILGSKAGTIKCALHLCGDYVNQALNNEPGEYLQQLLDKNSELGCVFERVQINATAVNGVDTSSLASQIPTLIKFIKGHPSHEFIIQKNEETEVVWKGLLQAMSNSAPEDDELEDGLQNVVFLQDESKGTGVLAETMSDVPNGYNVHKLGYAGGIGPTTIKSVMQQLSQKFKNNQSDNGMKLWIDMESRIRSCKDDGQDFFDVTKCYECVKIYCDITGKTQHPLVSK